MRRNQDRQIDVTDVQWLAVQIFRTLIPERSVYLVVSPSKGIYSHGRPGGTSLRHYGGRQFNQIKYVAPIQRQFVYLALLYHRTEGRRLGIQQRRSALHRYALGRRSQRHLKIQFQNVLHMQN